MTQITHLRIASDLHLEAFTGQTAETLRISFLGSFDDDHEAMLILAGDISSKPEQLIHFLSACCARYARVLFVPGNHEYYRHDFDNWNASMREELKNLTPRLVFTTDSIGYHVENDVEFIFGTLWGDGGKTKYDREAVSWSLNDFRLIRKGSGEKRFSVPDMMEINREHIQAIDVFLQNRRSSKTVVVTHHLPSRKLVSARFWPGNGDDGINGGFACDADYLIDEFEPNLWVHGHTHDTIDTMLGKTRVICNPAGYRGEWSTPHNTYFGPNENGKYIAAKAKRIEFSDL